MSELTKPSNIKRVMDFHNLNFQKKWGQNFLIDDNMIGKIVESYGLKEGDHVLEIGPGFGAITEQLLKKSIHLVAVEIDKGYVQILQAVFPGIHILQQDILKIDPLTFPKGIKIVGNLPYSITTPVLMHFLESSLEYTSMSFLMQKEVVERLSAQVGTKDYGRLSVVAQLHTEVFPGIVIPPQAFMPKPKVYSQMVHFVRKETPANVKAVLAVVKAGFQHRRKTIKNN